MTAYNFANSPANNLAKCFLLSAILFLSGCKLYDINYKDDDDQETINGVPNCNRLTTYQNFCVNSDTNIKLKLIQNGSFIMGASSQDQSADPNETPSSLITISKPFYIGVYEVSKSEWRSVMGGAGGGEPIAGISWNQIAGAGGFVKKLNADAQAITIGGVAYEYALPSEAQWEYAARGGSSGAYFWGAGDHGDYAWFSANSRGAAHTAGGKLPNSFGLYDTAGNAAEWVFDCYADYDGAAKIDPIFDCSNGDRVVRGGSFSSVAAALRSSARESRPKTAADAKIGFRLALAPKRD